MRKRPLCGICILFLLIQGIRVLFFGVEEMKPLHWKGQSLCEAQVELTGTVYKIEEKKKVMAVFLRDNIASVADQIVRESDLLVYISKNETDKSTKVRIGNRLRVKREAECFESARNPGNFDQENILYKTGNPCTRWADQIQILSCDTDSVGHFCQNSGEDGRIF